MGCGQMSVGREAANRASINCWYQRRCGAAGCGCEERINKVTDTLLSGPKCDKGGGFQRDAQAESVQLVTVLRTASARAASSVAMRNSPPVASMLVPWICCSTRFLPSDCLPKGAG